MKPYLEEMAANAPFHVSLHPNAGLPNQFGAYDESAETMASTLETYLKKGWINIVGGCCGTTPEHIKAIAEVASGYPPRVVPSVEPKTVLSGLEPLSIDSTRNFINIGER